MKALFTSSTILIHPPPGLPGCVSPWIVHFFEIGGKTRLYHPLYEDEDPLPNIPENLSLHEYFRPCHLALSYHMSEVNGKSCLRPRFKHDKVLVFNLSEYQSFPRMVEDCSILSLSKWGHLSGFRPPFNLRDNRATDQETWFNISYESVDEFDDILCFKGVVYALDRLGKLYHISANTFRIQKVLVDEPVVEVESAIRGWRKRLVGSSLDDNLYLVVRDDLEDLLRVYKMSCKISTWIEVHSFVDEDQILFLSRVNCYFATASEFSVCKLKNCILFYDAFPSYFHMSRGFPKKVKLENEIQVFWLGRNSHSLKPISSYPDFPAANFFSPPKWMLEASRPPLATPPITISKATKIGVSCVKFQGADVRSNLLPTLRSIWAKHGNLIGKDTVRSRDLLACALELLAKTIIILQNTTVRTLTESKAENLKSILFDLKRVGLKVDWLAPVVEKVLEVQKNNGLIRAMKDLEMAKAKADEEEREFLARSAKIKQEIEESRARLTVKFPFKEAVNLDYYLGEGLC